MVRRRLLTPRTGPSGRAANLHKLLPGTQRECPRSQLRSPHGVCVCAGGVCPERGSAPLPHPPWEILPGPAPPLAPAGAALWLWGKGGSYFAPQNGGTCSIHGGGRGAGGGTPRKCPQRSTCSPPRRLPRGALGPRGLRKPRVRKGKRLHPPSPCTQAETPLEASRLLPHCPSRPREGVPCVSSDKLKLVQRAGPGSPGRDLGLGARGALLAVSCGAPGCGVPLGARAIRPQTGCPPPLALPQPRVRPSVRL